MRAEYNNFAGPKMWKKWAWRPPINKSFFQKTGEPLFCVYIHNYEATVSLPQPVWSVCEYNHQFVGCFRLPSISKLFLVRLVCTNFPKNTFAPQFPRISSRKTGMETNRHYRRLVPDTKVLLYLLDCGNRVLLHLSDTLAQLDHQFPLNEIFTLCQMSSPRQCNLCICMVSARWFHWVHYALLLVIDRGRTVDHSNNQEIIASLFPLISFSSTSCHTLYVFVFIVTKNV